MAVVSKAPGRICLFGDHQDYLGLPIIACAIDRYVTISGQANGKDVFHIAMPDLGKHFELRFSEKTRTPHTSLLIDTLTVVARYGCHPNIGFDLNITSAVPINAGLSSSSAIVVAWVQWLLHTYGCDQEITPQLICQLAYEAEVLERGASGGKMDQYTSAVGGTIYLETDDNAQIENLSTTLNTLIVAASGIPKDTEGLLAKVKGKQLMAIDRVLKSEPTFQIVQATSSDYERLKYILSEEERPYLYAALKNYLITQEGLKHFRESELDPKHIGKLMTEHHNVLRDCLQITVPKIDHMIEAALASGAYGGKIVGSGGGGSIAVIASSSNTEKIIEALLNKGAVAAYAVSIAKGAHIL